MGQGWVVFIDESGNFDRDEEPVCVGGLLIQEPDRAGLAKVLRGALERVYPETRYPPHATQLNTPLAHLATWMQSRAQVREAHPRAAQLMGIAELLLSTGHPDAVEVVQAIHARKPVMLPSLRKCDGWLRVNAPAAWELLRRERDEAQERMRTLIKDLGEAYGARRCHVVAAAEPQAEPGLEERYLRLLSTLLGRVAALLRSSNGAPQVVHVLVAERWRTGTTRPIRVDEVQAAASRATTRPGPGDPRSVELAALPPQAFDGDAHPGLVLADFACNRIRTVLGSAARWTAVDRGCVGRVGLPVEAQPRALTRTLALPAAAAPGLAEDAIAAAFSGTASPGLDGIWPGWARDQAQRWVSTAGRMP